jgi:hypothetical protein
MALSPAANTRVDQLRSSLQLAQEQLTAALKPVDARPYFQVHTDGSVYTRDGLELRGPLTPLHAKAGAK